MYFFAAESIFLIVESSNNNRLKMYINITAAKIRANLHFIIRTVI